MEHRRPAVWIATLVAVVLVAAGGTWLVLDRAGDDSTGDPVAAVEESPSWLFSHTADGGTLTANGDGTYALTLSGIDPNVMAFTDRPDRQTAILTAQDLVEAWPSMFADSAPNAVLVEHDPAGDTDSLVIVLTDPALDGSTVTYTVEILEDEAHPSSVDGIVDSPHVEPPAEFADVSLFIDDVNLEASVFSCVNGNGKLISPPGTIPIVYKPTAPYMKLCSDAGGTVTATVVPER
jgi:hypothetical protein